MSDLESQEDEILALSNIYGVDSFVCSEEKPPYGQFMVDLDLPKPFKVTFSSDKEGLKDYEIDYLPPVVLHFDLPENYPSASVPSITLAAKWLTHMQLSQLCKRLDEIAEENKGDVVLFHWFSFLQDETLPFLDINSPLNLSNVIAKAHCTNQESKAVSDNNDAQNKSCDSDSLQTSDVRAVQDIAKQELLLPVILEFNQQKKEAVFQTTVYACQVCFQEKLGSVCLKFAECGHVFCNECMAGYFEVQINDGSVSALTCPNDKCESQALPNQVRSLVSDELYVRYERLLLQYSLDTMSDIMYCPRPKCGSVVLVDQDTGSCPTCAFVFCIYCKKVYHGVAPCKIQAEKLKEIREEYEKASAAGKRLLEKRYGLAMIKGIIADSYTEEWLQSHSKKCPHCSTSIEKIDGCNKMTCTKCRSHFCWLCGGRLNARNPYLHFNQHGTPCFNQLFAGIDTGADRLFFEEEENVLQEVEDDFPWWEL